jgi:hypothetical protein
MPNLLHFLPDLDALYALRRAPNFYEIHPWASSKVNVIILFMFLKYITYLDICGLSHIL